MVVGVAFFYSAIVVGMAGIWFMLIWYRFGAGSGSAER